MSNERTPFRCIGAKEAESILRSEGALVLDARDLEAFRRGHIKGAQHVTISELSTLLEGTEKSTPIIIYCYRGFASREYAQVLVDLGFARVYSLDGGYEAWLKKPRGPRKPKLSDTLQQWLTAQGFPSGDINGVITNSATPLMMAAYMGEIGIIRELMAAGASLDALNADGNNALWLACVGNHLDVIDVLIDSGIDINNSNVNGATALMYASSSGLSEVVRHLLARGADIAPETPEGFTALDMASTIECLTLLRQASRARTQRSRAKEPERAR